MLKLWAIGLAGSFLLSGVMLTQTSQPLLGWLALHFSDKTPSRPFPTREEVARQLAAASSQLPSKVHSAPSALQSQQTVIPVTSNHPSMPAAKPKNAVYHPDDEVLNEQNDQGVIEAHRRPDPPRSSFSDNRSDPGPDPVPSPVLTPLLTEYEHGLELSFVPPQTSSKVMKKALARLFLSPTRPKEETLLASSSINVAQTPYYYQRILDHHGEPVRYPAQAHDYADFLLQNRQYRDEQTGVISIEIPLESIRFSERARQFEPTVRRYAQTFDVDVALIYAVMETESHFNPLAVSQSNAIGLMQLKPEAAGRDVFEYVDARHGQPTLNELFDSENNIRMGTAYLWMLREVYLQPVNNPKSREMLVIAAYNGGIKTVMDLFGPDRARALKQMNRRSPEQIYRTLRYQHGSSETRQYLDKVLKARNRYQSLLHTDGKLKS
ncbi:murein transglycosylase domain-containing protein [Hydrogenovibrio halophilus]|uniref:murein transglycosylase domain-containing protein n=1 Tax=Hydrogenovibrio halophilus TaxID=373391 RepID=UPI000372A023|nr:murein transglycosylase domain-containing protein [Hydrogenovibrio halophilus]